MPNALYNVVLILGMVVAVLFSVLVFLTSKGDAMSGGSNIRTTFKGKTGIDELISRVVLGLGIGFMAIMLTLDIIAGHISKSG